jgi:hypothetical protein
VLAAVCQLLVSPDCVFDASLVPETCPTRFIDSNELINKFLESSIKVEVKRKHFSFGWNFSCFAAHLIERELF